jgi:hypothetical protein
MRLIAGDVEVTGEPHDRLTRLSAVMTEALEAHPEFGDDIKCIAILSDGERGGMSLFNYDDGRDAMADLLAQTQALGEAAGLTLDLLMVPNDASDLEPPDA